jgi:hypothetical protein
MSEKPNRYVVHASFGRSTGGCLAGNLLVFFARLAFPARTVRALAMESTSTEKPVCTVPSRAFHVGRSPRLDTGGDCASLQSRRGPTAEPQPQVRRACPFDGVRSWLAPLKPGYFNVQFGASRYPGVTPTGSEGQVNGVSDCTIVI